MSDLAAWLSGLGLEKYADLFAANEVDAATLPHLTEADLKELGLPIGPRRKILAALQASDRLPSPEPPLAAPEAPAMAEGERRQVTVLFADLVGSTGLSRALDPEEVHRLLQRFFGAVDRIVEEHGGRVDKHIGDCVMAVFGAPVSHGNDVERAVRAALAIKAAMPAMSADAARPVEVHIGVATGEVVASGLGSAAHREYAVTGESVNLAARLTDAAGPGEILVSNDVWRSLPDRLDGTDTGAIALDGFAAPVPVWRLAALGRPSRRRRLVGRRIELEQFRAVLAVCRETGRGCAVYLRGEAGIGKTRLLEEFLAAAGAQGFACHTGLVLDFGAGAGADAVRALVRDILGLDLASGAEAAAAAAAAALDGGLVARDDEVFLNDLLGVPQRLELRAVYDAMDNATRNAGARAAVARLVERASRRQPRVLAVEDLHWADPLTLSHLSGMAAATAECPAILLMTSRPEGDPIDQAWRAAAGGGALLSIDLGPLHPDEAGALAAPFVAANAALVRRCVERAGGNPLFLEQLLRNAEEGESASVPGSVQSLVQERLDRLDPADKVALQAAAVIGQRFDRAALAHLLDRPNYPVERFAAHLMVRPQGEEYLFAHALIHEAIYNSLLKSRRAELHRRAADWFSARDVTLQAAHLDRAEDPGAPAAYLAAARAQAADYRYEAARRLAERGRELARDRADRFALNGLLGDILHDLGDMPAALGAFQEALAAADVDAERCRALIGCAAVKRVTDDDLDSAFDDLERAEAMAVANGLKLEEARLRFLRGNLYFPRGDIAGCLREHARSLEIAREAGSAEREVDALGGLGDAEYVRGRMISSHARLSECVGLARRHGFGRIEVANSAQIAHTLLFFRPTREGLDHAVAAAAAAARVGHLRAELNARAAATLALPLLAEPDAGRAEVERAVDLVRRLGAWRFEQACHYGLGKAELAAGRRDAAAETLRRGLDVARRTGAGFHGPSICGALAVATDDAEERRAALAEGEAIVAKGCVGHNQLRFYADAIEACLRSGDLDGVERYAALLADYTQAEPLPWADFFIARGRALAARQRGAGGADLARELDRVRQEGERMDYRSALPAIEQAIAEMQEM